MIDREIRPAGARSRPSAMLAACAVLFLGLCASVTARAQNPTLRSLPDNTWIRVDRGGLAAPSGILAYSGMAFDSFHRKLVLTGGGHGDYWGNEVWTFDTDSLRWSRRYEPDPASAYTSTYVKAQYPGALFYPDPNEPLADARPLSRHTYDTVEYLEHVDKTIIFQGWTYEGIWGVPGQTNPLDTWLYDYNTNSWSWRNLARLPEPGGNGSCAAYDPETGLLFASGSSEATFSYNVNTDTWTKILDNPGPGALTGIETVMTYSSPGRKKMYLFGSDYPSTNELWEFDIPARSWRRLFPGGDVPPAEGQWGLVYDSVNDVLIAFGGSGSSGLTYVYDIANNVWRRQSPTTGSPATIDANTFGRFKYDPVNNVAFLVTVGSGWVVETWAYRFRASGGPTDATPPAPPSGLIAR